MLERGNTTKEFWREHVYQDVTMTNIVITIDYTYLAMLILKILHIIIAGFFFTFF